MKKHFEGLQKFISAIQNCFKETPLPVIQDKITSRHNRLERILRADFYHYFVYYANIKSIEDFWHFCKRHSAKFNGLLNWIAHGKQKLSTNFIGICE